MRTWILWLAMGLLGCSETPKVESLSSLAPEPLPRIQSDGVRDASELTEIEKLHEIEPADVFGEPIPAAIPIVEIDEDGRVFFEGKEVALQEAAIQKRFARDSSWLIRTRGEVYMAMLSPLLAVMDDADVWVWIKHPEAAVGYRVALRDEAAFQKWLSDAIPGRIRVIQRADGLELSTVMGKVVGTDVNGPSVPNRGGQWDIKTTRTALHKLAQRFKTADELGFVPSSATELSSLAKVMSANYRAEGKPYFEKIFMVYRRVP